MPRITILNQFYVPDISPTAHLSASLADHLAARGHDVTVVTSRGGYTGKVTADGSRGRNSSNDRRKPHVHRIWTPRLGKSTNLKRVIDYACFYIGALWKLLTMPSQDVVISLTTPPYIAWAGAAHRMLHPSSKLVLWSMDCYPDAAERMNVIRKGGLLSRSMRFLNRALFKRVDHLISLDTAMEELLISQYADAERLPQTTIIPNWEEASLFPPGARPERWNKADALGLTNRFVVLYLGNTGYGHHFDAVLEAAERLQDEPVTFLFIGGGRRWSEIESGVQRRNLTNVVLHGYVPKEHTPGVMACADCALITLRDNSLGVMSPSKLHSNLAMHLPIIYMGPQKSNVDDAIRRFQCGVSLRTDDTVGLEAFIRLHMARGPAFKAMQQQARHAFDEAYVDERTLPQFEEVVARVTSPRSEAVLSL
ncbi:MAG: glycosyltransferase family 4 protein [Phycisphaerales bacterium]